MYVYTYMRIISMNKRKDVCICVWYIQYDCMYVRIYVSMYECMYVLLYICMHYYICMYAHICELSVYVCMQIFAMKNYTQGK